MKNRKRAERRHHNDRILRKRFKQETQNLYLSHDRDIEEELQWCRHRARRRVFTNVNCSCAMCGNPRRAGWATWVGERTLQELRAADALADGIEEMLDIDLELSYSVESRDPYRDCEAN